MCTLPPPPRPLAPLLVGARPTAFVFGAAPTSTRARGAPPAAPSGCSRFPPLRSSPSSSAPPHLGPPGDGRPSVGCFEIPADIQATLDELDDFIEREIKPLEQEDDNIRFFDHRRE